MDLIKTIITDGLTNIVVTVGIYIYYIRMFVYIIIYI